MDLDELEQVNAAIVALEKHGYTEAAEALKAVCLRAPGTCS